MKNYAVLITESLQMVVHIEAGDAKEAVESIRGRWLCDDYILDADNFTGVEFSTVEDNQRVKITRDRCGNEDIQLSEVHPAKSGCVKNPLPCNSWTIQYWDENGNRLLPSEVSDYELDRIGDAVKHGFGSGQLCPPYKYREVK